jgi:two-component system sensor histidine kinase YesM
VINDQKQVISSVDKSIIGEDISKVIDMDGEELQGIEINGSLISTNEKIEVLYSMSEFTHLNWSIISQITLYELINERHQLVKVMGLIVTFSSILFVIIAIFIASTVTNPILRLTKLMSDIIDRDIRLRAKTDEKGEVAVLARGFNSMMDEIEQLIQQVYTEQALKRKGELALSQEQIKPHFLYNAIGTIEALININKYDDAKEMAKELASFYRLSLSNGEDIISIEEEIDLTKNYLKIQGYRYVEFFNSSIDVDPIIYKYKIPKMTLQPIVENAIYHGIKEKGSLGHIHIRSEMHEDHLCIFVFDDGCGMTPDRIEKCLTQDLEKKRFGIYSVNQRLKLYYGEAFGLSIISDVGKYTEVQVSIPKER